MRREAHGCWRERRREGREDQGFNSSSLLKRMFNSSSFVLDKGLNLSLLLKRVFNSFPFSLGKRFNSSSLLTRVFNWSSFSLDKMFNSSSNLNPAINWSPLSLGSLSKLSFMLTLWINWSPLVWKLPETSPLSRSLENGRDGCLKVSFSVFFSPKESKDTQTKDKGRVEKKCIFLRKYLLIFLKKESWK